MRRLSNMLIVISNMFWTEYLYWNFKLDFAKVNEPFGYVFGVYLVLVLVILILWLPFFKAKYNRRWATIGIAMSILLVSPLAVIGYILRRRLLPRKIKVKQLEVIE